MVDETVTREVSKKAFAKFLDLAVSKNEIAIFLISPEAEFLFVNDSACSSTGYSHEELLAMGVPDLDPWYDSSEWVHHWKEITEGGPQVFESRHKRKDGEIITVKIKSMPIELDGKNCICAFVQDVSEVTRTKALLTELKDEFDVIFNACSDWVFIIDDNGMILRATKGACESIGLDEVAVLGHQISEFMDEESREHFNSMFPAVLKDDETTCEIRFVHSDGTPRTFGCYPKAIVDEFNEITSVVILQRKI